MLDSLYVEAARKRGSIKEILPDIENEGSILEMWENIPISPYSNKFSLGAGDGSFNKKKYLAFTFYAVACESLIYDDDLVKIDDCILDTIVQTNYVDDLLRMYMGVLETKYAIKTIEEYDVDYYLFDGSLFGDLIRPFPSRISLSKEKRQEILNITLEELRDNIKYSDFKLNSDRLINKYYKNYKDKNDYSMFLTSIEQLILLRQLLEHKKKVIAISKTSSNRDIFKSNVPDIAIFDKYTKKQGISRIYYKKISSEIKYSFFIDDEFFKELVFTVFYLRLDDYKNVLKVELPYRASKEDILDIVQKLKKYSAEGYPYLLKKAHKDVVITNKNMDTLEKIVDIREKIGREMLK